MDHATRSTAFAATIRGLSQLLNVVLPPRCLACRESVPEQGRICAPCWNQVPFLSGSHCRACARPLAPAALAEPICELCAFEPPVWERAVAALRYEGLARSLILRLKHSDRIEGATLLADWMAMSVRPLVRPQTLILPVPLHRNRLLARGYNQSALLGRPLAQQLGCAFEADLLWRPRASRSQQGLTAGDRQANVTSDHFSIRDPDAITGQHIILVDDVLTTGSTFSACALTLLAEGAARVDIAALARVVRPE